MFQLDLFFNQILPHENDYSVSFCSFLSLHEEVNVLEIGTTNKVILETSTPLSESFIDSIASKFLSANCSGN